MTHTTRDPVAGSVTLQSWISHRIPKSDKVETRTTRIVKQPHFLCYMLYIEQWGFRYFMIQDHRERCPPNLDVLGRHTRVEVSTLTDLFLSMKTME